MRSIGVVLKKNEMIMAAARHGMRRYFLDGYRVLPFLDSSAEEKEAVILHNLELFLQEYRGARGNIFAAIPRSDAFIHYVHLPIAAEEDVYAAIGYDIDRHSPFAAEDVYYDCHIVRRMPESGQLYVMLVIVPRARVDFLVEIFKKLNIQLQGVELTTTALVNGHVPEPETEAVFNPAIFMQNAGVQKVVRLLARRFPSLEHYTEQQPDEQAPDGPPPIVLPVEYLENDHYELDIIADGDLHFSRVFACDACEPGEPQIQDIVRHGRQACIHLPFEQVEERPLRFLLSGCEVDSAFLNSIPEELDGEFAVVDSVPLAPADPQAASAGNIAPLLFVPAACALKGLKPVALDVNLIPPELRPRRKKSMRKLFIGAAVCLLVCCVAVLAVRWDMSRAAQQEETAAVLGRLSREYKLVEAHRAELERSEKLYQTALQIESSDAGKLNILRELTEIIPDDAWLTEFNYKDERREIRLSGYAVSASELLPILEQSDLFENVRFTSPITTDRRFKKEQFRLEMQVKLTGEGVQ
jgi:general secretion pathway protein L